MDIHDIQKRIEYLEKYSSAEKCERIKTISQQKTDHVMIVLEKIFQPDNISAVLRTAEGLGVNTVSLIENEHGYKNNRTVDKGSGQWLNLKKYQTTESCFKELKDAGYTIIATSPHAKAFPLSRLPLDKKIALVFGTETTGVSQYVLDNADGYVTIPMYGFTESFNISVAAALCLYDVTRRLHETDTINWKMSPEEQKMLALTWLRNSVSGAQEIERRFFPEN